MNTRFCGLLRDLEASQNITILYACESGSRGWEVPSPDSDYDLRFIFIRPLSAYLSVAAPSDSISLPLDAELDVTGWDLRKVLTLLVKSNVTPFEWLQSPIIYQESPGFRDALGAICTQYFNPRSNAFHYLGIAKGAFASRSGNRIGIKKLVYVLRPILAAAWCLERNEIAPMRFSRLAEMLPASLRTEVDDLFRRKATMSEAEETGLSDALLAFITDQFNTLQLKASALQNRRFEAASLNQFFYETLSRHDDTGTQTPGADSA